MTMVSALLSNPLFKDFRIVAGKSGLHNQVVSTGYLEWEQDSEIVRSFGQGEFVITILSAAKDDLEFANRCLKLLIHNHVAAIAIKDIYYSDVAEEIKNCADQNQVPIFFFSEIYIDDVIVAIRSELSNSLHMALSNSIFTSLLFDTKLHNLEKESLMRKINSFFYSDSIFAAYISRKEDMDHISDISMSNYNVITEQLKDGIPLQIDDISFVHTFTPYKRGMFLISTCNTADEVVIDSFCQQVKEEYFNQNIFDGFHIGTGNPIHGFAQISDLLLEAIWANTSCILDEKRFSPFSDIGEDCLFFSHCYTPYYKRYYNNILEALSKADSNSASLVDTLLTFVHYEGNIEKTANAMFQHKNTIRYRINKIGTLLHIDNEMQLYSAMYIFSRLHHGRQYLDVFYTELGIILP